MYEHKNKLTPGFTKKYCVDILVFVETFTNIWEALENEKRLKGWSRKKKENLINQQNPEWLDLSIHL